MATNKRIRWLPLLLAGALFLSGCSSGPGKETAGPQSQDLGGLVCMERSLYTGGFPEDGTGRQVEDVAAIRVHNSSDKYLDYATMVCNVSGRTGSFEITGLPPGGTAWVMEKSGMTIDQGETFTAEPPEDPVFREDAVMSTDKLSAEPEEGGLTVTNRSDQTLKDVCVYYKSVRDGVYFGGITYMLVIGDLEPGASATKQSGHFGDSSKIVRYSFQESG